MCWTYFHQTFSFVALWKKNERLNVWNQKVKGQGHNVTKGPAGGGVVFDTVRRVLVSNFQITTCGTSFCIGDDGVTLYSAFHPSRVGKSSTSLLAGVKAGRVHLCRVAGNTV